MVITYYLSDYSRLPKFAPATQGDPRAFYGSDWGGFGSFREYIDTDWLAHPWQHPRRTDQRGIFSCPAGIIYPLPGILNVMYLFPYTATFDVELPAAWNENYSGTSVGVCDIWTLVYSSYPYIPTGHQAAGVNVLYFDGHVTWKRTEDFKDVGYYTYSPYEGFKEAFNE